MNSDEDVALKKVRFLGMESDFLVLERFLQDKTIFDLKKILCLNEFINTAAHDTDQYVIIADKKNFDLLSELDGQTLSRINLNTNISFLLLINIEDEIIRQSPMDIDYLQRPFIRKIFLHRLNLSFSRLNLINQKRKIEKTVKKSLQEFNVLSSIGIALSAEKDTDKLLDLILINARQITHADSGSIYIVEGEKIRFMFTQSDTIKTSFEQFIIDIDKNSIAGYVALTQKPLNIKDVYNLPPDSPFRFNQDIDENIGYYTKSMLVVPMSNQKKEIIGVLQLINKKKDKNVFLHSKDTTIQETIPFEERDIYVLSALAGQAGVSLENSMLYNEIQRLFKGFVKASVTAIEARDPTTSGHSERVSKLTVTLAEKVSMSDSQNFADVNFSREQIMEIEYASLLHDFGKIGVRERVLVKANKLCEGNIELIKSRFAFIKRTLQVNGCKKRLEYELENGREKFFLKKKEFDGELKEAMKNIDDQLLFICQANKPSLSNNTTFQYIFNIAEKTFENLKGEEENFLTCEEMSNLSIPAGSLNESERREIESHVTHTYNILRQIPWTKNMRGIPLFAYSHHEHLKGSGYPRGITSENIPLQAKMIAISDLYDALTAEDRPYKKAIPCHKALDILRCEAKEKKIDQDLLEIFIKAKVYEVI